MKKVHNSSTSNSKKYFILGARIILFLLIFILIDNLIAPFLKEFEYENYYSKRKWEDFYKQEDLDLVFVGSSHAYRSFDPSIFDRNLDINSFNMGGPLQKPVESYRVVKEILRKNKPKVIVYESYFEVFNEDKYLNPKIWTYDQLETSTNKLGYLLEVFDMDQYPYALVKSMRYHDKVEAMLKYYLLGQGKKITESYEDEYKTKGFLINHDILDKEELLESLKEEKSNKAKKFTWNKKQEKYFKKTMDLLKKEGVEVILVTSPVSDTYYNFVDEHRFFYKETSDKFKEYAQKYDFSYIDYNEINKEDNLVIETDFEDGHHLNYNGAQKISEDLSKRIKHLFKKD